MQGLTVELRPFQRQALRFMLDNERKRGGHRDHFWYQKMFCHSDSDTMSLYLVILGISHTQLLKASSPPQRPVKIMRSATHASCCNDTIFISHRGCRILAAGCTHADQGCCLLHPDVGKQMQCACRVPVLTADGEHFWYSPLHRRAVWKVPAAPCGGFLAEEMVSTIRVTAQGCLWL